VIIGCEPVEGVDEFCFDLFSDDFLAVFDGEDEMIVQFEC